MSDSIQWFPGHMARALREMKQKLTLVDIVLELADARLPQGSRNPEIAKIRRDKPCLLLLTKADLADPRQTDRWSQRLQNSNLSVLAIDSLHKKGLQQIVPHCRTLLEEKLARAEAKGRMGRPIRAMVVGIPNVGKSTVINALAGHKAAKTENRPGVTRAPQWIRIPGLELMDMPGVLWPKIQDPASQLALAATGAIRDQVLALEDVAVRTFDLLCHQYPEALAQRYQLENVQEKACEVDPNALPGTVAWGIVQLFEEAAQKRGCLLKGGRLDLMRFSRLFLEELRTGKIGRISLEWADNENGETI